MSKQIVSYCKCDFDFICLNHISRNRDRISETTVDYWIFSRCYVFFRMQMRRLANFAGAFVIHPRSMGLNFPSHSKDSDKQDLLPRVYCRRSILLNGEGANDVVIDLVIKCLATVNVYMGFNFLSVIVFTMACITEYLISHGKSPIAWFWQVSELNGPLWLLSGRQSEVYLLYPIQKK